MAATKTHPAILNVICKSMAELFIVSTVEKKTRAKPRIIQFTTHNLITGCIDNCFISKRLRSMFLVTGGTAVIFVYNQNGENLAKSGSSARRARRANFILYVSSLMLVLLSYHWFVSRSGPTFEKIAFNFRYVTLCTFRSLVGDIFEKS